MPRPVQSELLERAPQLPASRGKGRQPEAQALPAGRARSSLKSVDEWERLPPEQEARRRDGQAGCHSVLKRLGYRLIQAKSEGAGLSSRNTFEAWQHPESKAYVHLLDSGQWLYMKKYGSVTASGHAPSLLESYLCPAAR